MKEIRNSRSISTCNSARLLSAKDILDLSLRYLDDARTVFAGDGGVTLGRTE